MSSMILNALGYSPANSAAFGTPVQNVSQLSALADQNISDKQLRLVEDSARIFRFDKESAAVADGASVIALSGNRTGRWIAIRESPLTHALLQNLLNDDHTQYVHNSVARNIAAVHTFNPPSPSAPFLLGTNARGQKVVGLNADMLNGLSSAEYVSLAALISVWGAPEGIATLGTDGKHLSAQILKLANGMPAYVNPNNALISIASTFINFILATNGTRNVYLNLSGDIASNILGFVVPRNATVVSVSIGSSANATTNTNAVFNLRKNDSTSTLGAYALQAGTDSRTFSNLNLNLNAGDELQCYLSANSNIPNPIMFVELAWRN